ncbi:MAG TPA: type III-B CRISPR module-associated protein Cmr5 [Ktedonobacteraceae bacterium]|nr:type III-B CRISPR module-associated protein Cmr5 [Ktedonobacteraceae bacterium]
MQTLDQQYADIIRRQVLVIAKQSDYKKYGAMAHKLPILIHTAGLLQALEFVNSRGEDIQKQILEDLAVTIGQQNTVRLLEAVQKANLSAYMRLTRHILGALLWYKRFAQSILGVEAGEDTAGSGKDND